MKKLFAIISFVLVLSFLATACSSDEETSATAKSDGIIEVTPPIGSIEDETTVPPTSSETDLANVDLDKVIALTFDDGPATNGSLSGDTSNPSSTERILNVLEKYGCKATFFVQGVNADYAEFKERNSAIIKREHDLGMEIGNHSYDHPYFNKISSEEIGNQISKCNSIIESAIGDGYSIPFMRTPGGAEKQSVKDAIDMPIILWDIDTLDWDTKDADNTYNVIMNNIKGGSIVLMHDIYQTTADAVERVVPALVEQGYKLVTISELFDAYGKELKPHTTYYNAR